MSPADASANALLAKARGLAMLAGRFAAAQQRMPRLENTTAASSEAGRRPTPRRATSWSEINLLVDAALLVVFTALFTTSVILRFVFPPGPVSMGWTLWSLDYDAWSGLQFGLLVGLTLGILVHVMLHWSWVCNVVAARLRGRGVRVDEGLQTIYGVGLLIMLLLVAVIAAGAATLTIHRPA